jgi:Tfp pilus assembly protein PilO
MRLELNRWAAAALASLGLALLVLATEVGPRLGECVELWQELRRTRQELARAEDAPAERARMLDERRLLDEELKRLLVSAPRRDQLSVVLDEINRKASIYGVAVGRIEPGAAVRETGHSMLPLRVSVQGRFHELVGVIDELERSPNLMQIRSAGLTSREAKAEGLEGELLIGVVQVER